MRKSSLVVLSLSLLFAACQKSESPSNVESAGKPGLTATSDKSKSDIPKTEAVKPELVKPATARAKIGAIAPDFELMDLDGNAVKLKEHKGKVVVLEWFNPECPFVTAAHTKGSLVDLAARLAEKGVIYLAINSGGPGKQGHGVEKNRAGAERFKLTHPILMDESGKVGRIYGAENTPHSFVIDTEGVLVYAGAVDNAPDGEAREPEDGSLRRHLEEAVKETLVGKPVSVSESRAWGCGVKYGS